MNGKGALAAHIGHKGRLTQLDIELRGDLFALRFNSHTAGPIGHLAHYYGAILTQTIDLYTITSLLGLGLGCGRHEQHAEQHTQSFHRFILFFVISTLG